MLVTCAGVRYRERTKLFNIEILLWWPSLLKIDMIFILFHINHENYYDLCFVLKTWEQNDASVKHDA